MVGIAQLEWNWPGLSVFQDPDSSQNLLGLIWQVQAAVVALVLAASLFAFESLTRERQDVQLVSYASRSWLTPTLMLSASGLLAVAAVLVFVRDWPAPFAAACATAIALLGLAWLPFFFVRALHVVNPSWFRQQRLKDITSATSSLVQRDAFERSSYALLVRWARGSGAQVHHRMSVEKALMAEVAPGIGETLDIDLDRLDSRKRDGPSEGVVISTYLSDSVFAKAPLVSRSDSEGRGPTRRAVTISRTQDREDPLEDVLRDLTEEGFESIRRESPVAASQVADTYASVWLAWARAWEEYGIAMKGGLIGGLEPFAIRPSRQLGRSLWKTIDSAVQRGLKYHVEEYVGVLPSVAFDAVRSGADDLIDEMLKLSRGLLLIESRAHEEAALAARDDAVGFQLSLLDYIEMQFSAEGVSLNPVAAEGQLNMVTRSIVESMKIGFDRGRMVEVHSLDQQFETKLKHWDPLRAWPLADEMIANPDRYSASEADIAEASLAQELESIRQGFDQLRRAGRLSLVGWIIHRVQSAPEEAYDSVELALGILDSLGNPMEVSTATGLALDGGWMSDWVLFDLPSGEAHMIDSDGPVLDGLALWLLTQASIDELPPESWMSKHRIDRLQDALPGMQELLVSAGFELPGTAPSTIDTLTEVLARAIGDQQTIESQELASRPLDPTKLVAFERGVVEAWTGDRLFGKLATLGDMEVLPLSPGDRHGVIRLRPSLDFKGMFVTPTNFVGVDGNARDRGRALARAEVSSIVALSNRDELVQPHGNEARERVLDAIAQFRSIGYSPSVLFVSFDWRLMEDMGLQPRPDAPADVWRSNVRGELDGVTVVRWWGVEDGAGLLIDLEKFCQAHVAIDADGAVAIPEVRIVEILKERALELQGELDGDIELSELLTRVEVSITGIVRLELKDEGAARWIEIKETTQTADEGF